MQTQEPPPPPPSQQQLLSANQSIPTYLVDIMQNYDQTMQQQIDSTDYFIDEPDNENDGCFIGSKSSQWNYNTNANQT
ncbi:unnamed protein product [Rotaria socialis]|uniref:Uncharacterized protein n=1 Tax=Rotaria socialis TaxID=392032 RepID=A0A821KE91_9BILA|nr:unnamed protein product [Rotaria socialis]